MSGTDESAGKYVNLARKSRYDIQDGARIRGASLAVQRAHASAAVVI